MPTEINDYIANVEVISNNIRGAFDGLSNEQLNWKPDAKSWSVAQCLEHLIVTNDLYFENIQKVADGTHVNNWYSAIPLIPAILGWLLKRAVSPDTARKMKTFQIFEPAASEINEHIVNDFCKNQERLISLMEATKNSDLRKIIIPEPIGAAFNISLLNAYEILVLHERRHFNQAKRVMEVEGFPK